MVSVYIPLSYWKMQTYTFSWGQHFNYISSKQAPLQRRSRPPRAAHLQPAQLRPAAFQWLAGTSVSAAPKNCLFALTITHWCFSFDFSSLSKAIIQFKVFQGSEFRETRSVHLLKAGVYIGLQWAHLWHFGGAVPEEARGLSVTCWSNMLA